MILANISHSSSALGLDLFYGLQEKNKIKYTDWREVISISFR